MAEGDPRRFAETPDPSARRGLDEDEARQDTPEYYSTVVKAMEKFNKTFDETKDARQVVEEV